MGSICFPIQVWTLLHQPATLWSLHCLLGLLRSSFLLSTKTIVLSKSSGFVEENTHHRDSRLSPYSYIIVDVTYPFWLCLELHSPICTGRWDPFHTFMHLSNAGEFILPHLLCGSSHLPHIALKLKVVASMGPCQPKGPYNLLMLLWELCLNGSSVIVALKMSRTTVPISPTMSHVPNHHLCLATVCIK